MVYEYILALIVKLEIFMRFSSFSIEKMKHIQPFYSIFCAKNDFEWHKKSPVLDKTGLSNIITKIVSNQYRF